MELSIRDPKLEQRHHLSVVSSELGDQCINQVQAMRGQDYLKSAFHRGDEDFGDMPQTSRMKKDLRLLDERQTASIDLCQLKRQLHRRLDAIPCNAERDCMLLKRDVDVGNLILGHAHVKPRSTWKQAAQHLIRFLAVAQAAKLAQDDGQVGVELTGIQQSHVLAGEAVGNCGRNPELVVGRDQDSSGSNRGNFARDTDLDEREIPFQL